MDVALTRELLAVASTGLFCIFVSLIGVSCLLLLLPMRLKVVGPGCRWIKGKCDAAIVASKVLVNEGCRYDLSEEILLCIWFCQRLQEFVAWKMIIQFFMERPSVFSGIGAQICLSDRKFRHLPPTKSFLRAVEYVGGGRWQPIWPVRSLHRTWTRPNNRVNQKSDEKDECSKATNNQPTGDLLHYHFLQNVKGDAAAEPAPVQQGSCSPSHPPTCSPFFSCDSVLPPENCRVLFFIMPYRVWVFGKLLNGNVIIPTCPDNSNPIYWASLPDVPESLAALRSLTSESIKCRKS